MRTSGAILPVFGRFLVSGLANTVLTYALYLALLQFLPYLAAYVVAFLTGIVIAYWLNRSFVFRTTGRPRTAVLFPFVYLIQLVAGALVALVWVDLFHLPRELAAAAAIGVTVPLTFILTKRLFETRPATTDDPMTATLMTGIRTLLIVLVTAVALIPVGLVLSNAAAWVRFGVDLPYQDDWRALMTARAGSLDLGYLFAPENDTLYPVGKALDSLAQIWIGGNAVVYQLLSMVFILGSYLALQWKLTHRILSEPVLAVAAFSVTVLSLRTWTYWGQSSLAYHQSIPVICLLGLLVLATSRVTSMGRLAVSAGVLGALAGFSYISGALAILAAGVSLLCLSHFLRSPLRDCTRFVGSGAAVIGVVSSAAQLLSILVFSQGGRTSIPMGKPWEMEYWLYALGVVANSLLLPAGTPALSFVAVVVIVAVVIGIAGFLTMRVVRRRASDRLQVIAVIYLTLVSTLGVYLAVVAAGRVHHEVSSASLDPFVIGFGRFYQWWIAALWPVLVAMLLFATSVVRSRRGRIWVRAIDLTAISTAAIFIAVIWQTGALNHQGHYSYLAGLREANLRCIERSLGTDGHCRYLDLDVALAPAVLYAASVGSSFVRYLADPSQEDATAVLLRPSGMPLGLETSGLSAMSMGDGEYWVENSGNPYVILSVGDQAAMAACRHLRLRADIRAGQPEWSQTTYWPITAPAWSTYASRWEVVPADDSWAHVSFDLYSRTGFYDRLRFDPVGGSESFALRDLAIECRSRAE